MPKSLISHTECLIESVADDIELLVLKRLAQEREVGVEYYLFMSKEDKHFRADYNMLRGCIYRELLDRVIGE